MKNILLLLPLIFLFSCQQKENKNSTIDAEEPIKIGKEKAKEENRQIGDTIFMNLKNHNGLYIANGSLDSIQSKIHLKFMNEGIGILNAKIILPAGKENLRFNQIIFPDKTTDGPFGMDLKTKLNQKGTYILVIGHSQMAENRYWGKFTVQLDNKEDN